MNHLLNQKITNTSNLCYLRMLRESYKRLNSENEILPGDWAKSAGHDEGEKWVKIHLPWWLPLKGIILCKITRKQDWISFGPRYSFPTAAGYY